MIDYLHTPGVHTTKGAEKGLEYLIRSGIPSSLLDVGCGPATWIRAAHNRGVKCVVGVDGIAAEPSEELRGLAGISFIQHDLSTPLNLNRKFDLVLSLEVAEHLPSTHERIFVQNLCLHGDRIFFSAASPRQFGHNHLNCQWLAHWQSIFNENGFVCNDQIRRDMWDDPDVEPWYRQNIIECVRDPSRAGSEPRIARLVHPEMLHYLSLIDASNLREGRYPLAWYQETLLAAFKSKLLRKLRS